MAVDSELIAACLGVEADHVQRDILRRIERALLKVAIVLRVVGRRDARAMV